MWSQLKNEDILPKEDDIRSIRYIQSIKHPPENVEWIGSIVLELLKFKQPPG